VIDTAPLGHPPEERGLARIFAELRLCEGKEGIVDIVRRNGRCDPIDIGGCHRYLVQRQDDGSSFGRSFGDGVWGLGRVHGRDRAGVFDQRRGIVTFVGFTCQGSYPRNVVQ
jgi:hypothetical protein